MRDSSGPTSSNFGDIDRFGPINIGGSSTAHFAQNALPKNTSTPSSGLLIKGTIISVSLGLLGLAALLSNALPAHEIEKYPPRAEQSVPRL